jgi:hypothetical protein
MIAARPDVPVIFATGYRLDIAQLHKVQEPGSGGYESLMCRETWLAAFARLSTGILLKSITRRL